jgi:hypothetical protein
VVQYIANELESLRLERDVLTPSMLNELGLLLQIFELQVTSMENMISGRLIQIFEDTSRNVKICIALIFIMLVTILLAINLTLVKRVEATLLQARRNILVLPYSILSKEFRIINYLKNTTGFNMKLKL